jgi:hypothetical protein
MAWAWFSVDMVGTKTSRHAATLSHDKRNAQTQSEHYKQWNHVADLEPETFRLVKLVRFGVLDAEESAGSQKSECTDWKSVLKSTTDEL